MKQRLISLLNFLWPKKVKWQLVLGVALVHAVLMSLFIFDLVKKEKTLLLNQFYEQAIFSAKTLSSNSVSWVLSNDVSGLQELILTQRQHKELKYAFITTMNGQVIAHTDAHKIGQYLTDENSLNVLQSKRDLVEVFNGQNLLDIASRIKSNGKTIGWVRLGFNTDFIDNNLYTSSRQGLLYTLFTILVGSLFALFLGNSLTRRIRLLIQASGAIDPTRSEQLFKRTNQDEVGELMNNFNLMQLKLHKQYTQIQSHVRKIENLAFHDALTGLPNRTMLERDIYKSIKTNLKSHQFSALILFDLDNFKQLNDTHGHEIGDTLLKQIAQRTLKTQNENHKVYRFGGDEFVVLIDQLGSDYTQATSACGLFALELLASLTEPFTLGNMHYQSTVSIGFYIMSNDYDHPKQAISEALKRADIALFSAKDNGRNQVAQFEPSMLAEVMENDELTYALKRAVEGNQLKSVIQPKYDMKSNQIIGGEILSRWDYRDSSIPPHRFIELAEKNALIGLLTRNQVEWLFKTLNQCHCKMLEFSLNLSPMLIFDNDFLTDLKRLTEHYNIDPNMIKFEITEGVFISHNQKALRFMNQLKNAGYKVSLDDFGTGFSSLSYLKNLPIDELKIDKAFVDALPGNRKAEAIAKTIIDLSQNLQIEVIAEGVETQNQRDFLIRNDCIKCQGYLYSRPLKKSDFIDLLNQNRSEFASNNAELNAAETPEAP